MNNHNHSLMNYNTYPSTSALNCQITDNFWAAQGVFPPLGGGVEGYLQPEAQCCPLPYPEYSPNLQVTPPLTNGSPSEGWPENESLEAVTPEAAAALSYNVWADGHLGSCFETAAPLDPLSSAEYVNNEGYMDTIAIEKDDWFVSLFNGQLEENTGEQQGLENVTSECTQTSPTTYPHPHSREDDFEYANTNHSLSAYFAPGPASTTCLPHFPGNHPSSLSHPAVAQANVAPCYADLPAIWTIQQHAHSPSHGRPCMAQATVEPNTQQHWGQMPPIYGAYSSLTNYETAPPIMEKHRWHQQIQNPRQRARTSRYDPYPQACRNPVAVSNFVLGPVASSSRLPDANVVHNPGYYSPAAYTLTQPMEPTLEGAGDEKEWYHCQWEGCTDSGPMKYDEVHAHFLNHGILEDGKIKECRWKGCRSQTQFPMNPSGFKRHVKETQKHVGFLTLARCARCDKRMGLRSILLHRKKCTGKSKARAEAGAGSSSA